MCCRADGAPCRKAMNIERAKRYNVRRSSDLWVAADLIEPFCSLNPNSDEFARAVRAYQKDAGISADGMLGVRTLRRLIAEADAVKPDPPEAALAGSEYMIFNGEPLRVPGVHIITMNDDGGMGFTKGFGKWPKPVDSLIGRSDKYAYMLGTVHWDCCMDSERCFSVLKNRGLSTCFGISNPRKEDGVVPVYQWLDPGKHRGYHAGTRANRASLLSFDLSNAVYLKYARKYKSRVGIERPVIYPRRMRKGMLGMYRGQIIALLRILKAVSGRTGLPLTFPTDENGRPIDRPWDRLFSGDYHGAHTHLHITRKKWDVLGLEEQIIAMLLESADLRHEFPSLVECFQLCNSGWLEWLQDVKKKWVWKEMGW